MNERILFLLNLVVRLPVPGRCIKSVSSVDIKIIYNLLPGKSFYL